MSRSKTNAEEVKIALKDLRPVYEVLISPGGNQLKTNLKKGLAFDLKYLLDVIDITDDRFQKELYVRFARMRATLELLRQFEQVKDEVQLLTDELSNAGLSEKD